MALKPVDQIIFRKDGGSACSLGAAVERIRVFGPIEPLWGSRRLQHLSRLEPDEQDNEQVCT